MNEDAALIAKALEYGVLGIVAFGLWILFKNALADVKALNASRVEDLKQVAEVVGGNTKAMVEWTAAQAERNRTIDALARAVEMNARAVESNATESRNQRQENEERWRRIETELARLTSSEQRLREFREALGREPLGRTGT